MTERDPHVLIVANLLAAYPQARFDRTNVEAYVRALRDLPPAELGDVAVSLIATSEFPPTIAALRTAYFERAMRLPPVEEAWTLAHRYATTRPKYVDCSTCDGRGEIPPDVGDVHMPCPDCRMQGQIEVARRAIIDRMPEEVAEALASIGGPDAVAQRDVGVAVAQFRKAYAAIRERSLAETNAASIARLALENGQRRPELEP